MERGENPTEATESTVVVDEITAEEKEDESTTESSKNEGTTDESKSTTKGELLLSCVFQNSLLCATLVGDAITSLTL